MWSIILLCAHIALHAASSSSSSSASSAFLPRLIKPEYAGPINERVRVVIERNQKLQKSYHVSVQNCESEKRMVERLEKQQERRDKLISQSLLAAGLSAATPHEVSMMSAASPKTQTGVVATPRPGKAAVDDHPKTKTFGHRRRSSAPLPSVSKQLLSHVAEAPAVIFNTSESWRNRPVDNLLEAFREANQVQEGVAEKFVALNRCQQSLMGRIKQLVEDGEQQEANLLILLQSLASKQPVALRAPRAASGARVITIRQSMRQVAASAAAASSSPLSPFDASAIGAVPSPADLPSPFLLPSPPAPSSPLSPVQPTQMPPTPAVPALVLPPLATSEPK